MDPLLSVAATASTPFAVINMPISCIMAMPSNLQSSFIARDSNYAMGRFAASKMLLV
jgi:hypothetical protein